MSQMVWRDACAAVSQALRGCGRGRRSSIGAVQAGQPVAGFPGSNYIGARVQSRHFAVRPRNGASHVEGRTRRARKYTTRDIWAMRRLAAVRRVVV